MNPDLRNLIYLQDLDQKISILKKQISEIPVKTEALRNEFQKLTQSHQERATLGQELGKQRRTREGEVDLVRAKLSRLKDQLMAVKTNKEYTAMLHEIQAAEDQIRQVEDGILEIMEETEAMEAGLAEEERELKARGSELDQQIRATEETLPILQVEVDRLSQERTALQGSIGAEWLARYRRIADARKGVALAEVKNELCSACHVRIRPQVYAELLRNEEIHVCDSCSRILFSRESL